MRRNGARACPNLSRRAIPQEALSPPPADRAPSQGEAAAARRPQRHSVRRHDLAASHGAACLAPRRTSGRRESQSWRWAEREKAPVAPEGLLRRPAPRRAQLQLRLLRPLWPLWLVNRSRIVHIAMQIQQGPHQGRARHRCRCVAALGRDTVLAAARPRLAKGYTRGATHLTRPRSLITLTPVHARLAASLVSGRSRRGGFAVFLALRRRSDELPRARRSAARLRHDSHRPSQGSPWRLLAQPCSPEPRASVVRPRSQTDRRKCRGAGGLQRRSQP